MTSYYDFIVAGGDMRMKHLASMLSHDGYKVKSIFSGEDDPEPGSLETKTVILPVPCCTSEGNLNAPFSKTLITPLKVIQEIKGCRAVYGGLLPADFCRTCKEKGIETHDYMKCEPLTVINAEATAEGALKCAIENTDFVLCRAKVLVAGYGRIGKILSRYLAALGADVTVEARKAEDLAWIRVNGYKPLHLESLEMKVQNFDIIFNTVPYPIFTKREVKNINKDTLYIELASLPGGLEEEAAKQAAFKIVKAASLPGKTAPGTSAEAIRDAVLGIY